MKTKTVVARLALFWILTAQMAYVCFSAASGPNSLSRLEAIYAVAPTAESRAALDHEFERVASYESHRAIAQYTLLLAIDVVLIALFWNLGVKRRAANTAEQPSANPIGPTPHSQPSHVSAS